MPPPETAGNSGPVDHPHGQRRPREGSRSYRLHRCGITKSEMNIQQGSGRGGSQCFSGSRRCTSSQKGCGTGTRSARENTQQRKQGSAVHSRFIYLRAHRCIYYLHSSAFRAFNHELEPGIGFCSRTAAMNTHKTHTYTSSQLSPPQHGGGRPWATGEWSGPTLGMVLQYVSYTQEKRLHTL